MEPSGLCQHLVLTFKDHIPLVPPIANAHLVYQLLKNPSIMSCKLFLISHVSHYAKDTDVWTIVVPLMMCTRLLSQVFFTSDIKVTKSRLSAAEETIEPSQTSAIVDLCQSLQFSISAVTGTVKLRPRARHTL